MMIDLNAVIEKAFDYRGDITLKLKDRRTVIGYMYNRESKGSVRCPEPFVEIMTEDNSKKHLIKYSEIENIDFTGKDAAAGKSWEEWAEKEQTRKKASAQT